MQIVGWENFFMAEAGAAAALAGLVFVGISINLTRIMSFPHLPQRALDAIVLMAQVLIVSCLMLIPAQPELARASELLAVSIVAWLLMTWPNISGRHKVPPPYVRLEARAMWFKQIATIPFIAAGVLFLASYPAAALALIAAGSILSFVIALLSAWVLLVEINR